MFGRVVAMNQSAGNVNRSELIGRVLSEGQGNTGETCRGLLRFLLEKRVPITMYEQSPEMLTDKNLEQYQWFVNTLSEMGFATNAKLFESKHYLVPTTRKRTYGIIVEYRDIGLTHKQAADMAQAVLDNVRSMGTTMPRGLKDYLMSATDPRLATELGRLQETQAKDLEMNAEDTSWRTDFKRACDKYNLLPSQVRIASDISSSPWIAALPLREQKGVQVHTTGRPTITTIETSQSITHMTCGEDDLVSTLLPRGRVVLRSPFVKTPRCLQGREKLEICGVPAFAFDSFAEHVPFDHQEDALFSSLAGNAFQAEIVYAFVLSILANLAPEHIEFAKKYHGALIVYV